MAEADGEVAKRRKTSLNAQNKPKRLIRCGSCDRPLVIAQFTDDKFGVVCAHYKAELVSQDYMHPCIYLGRAEADGVVAKRPRTSQKAQNKPERWIRCRSCTRPLSIAQFTNEKFGVNFSLLRLRLRRQDGPRRSIHSLASPQSTQHAARCWRHWTPGWSS